MWCKEIINKNFIEKPVREIKIIRNYNKKTKETKKTKVILLLYTNARAMAGKMKSLN